MSDPRSLAVRSYQEVKVRGASAAELIALLYEGLARELRRAAAALARGDVAGGGTALGAALAILAHLRTSLNHEAGGELATNLERLYVYWTRRITEANIGSQPAPLEEAAAQVEALRAAWNEGVVAGGQQRREAQLEAPSQAPRVLGAAGTPAGAPAQAATSVGAARTQGSAAQGSRIQGAPGTHAVSTTRAAGIQGAAGTHAGSAAQGSSIQGAAGTHAALAAQASSNQGAAGIQAGSAARALRIQDAAAGRRR